MVIWQSSFIKSKKILTFFKQIKCNVADTLIVHSSLYNIFYLSFLKLPFMVTW